MLQLWAEGKKKALQGKSPGAVTEAVATNSYYCWDEPESNEEQNKVNANLTNHQRTPKDPCSQSCLSSKHAPMPMGAPSPRSIAEEANEVLKDSWEDYGAADVIKLSDQMRKQGDVLISLRGGEVRWVDAKWFDCIDGTPLHHMLFDMRFDSTGSLDSPAEVFDDICAYLLDQYAGGSNRTGRSPCLPPARPRYRRRRLREAADFYGLQALSEEIDDADAEDAAAREKAAREAKAASDAAAAAMRRNRRRLRRQQGWKGTEDRAFQMVEQFELYSMRCHTKAQAVTSMLSSVQKACGDGAGVGHGQNRQRFYTAKSAKKNRIG
eukprot:TRINITY_DN20918_c0_g1_i1.p1 TRINITY_DN20918_c0_g1~~TRINITY_DN20918_c0_g1_i1.p1  ORF type:complete len:323 (-),score=63.16 TRINITY_DN20918_c0_g1_i1:150-1118(-)